MKKINILLALVAIIFLSIAAKFTPTSFVGGPATPYLPEEPFDYDIPFPYYLTLTPGWVKTNAGAVNLEMTREKATLGRVLFYDKRLSENYEVSCATCHKQEFAFADNQRFSEGINGAKTDRNTPNINDLGWRVEFSPFVVPLFWDARETKLERMVLQPISHQGELGHDLEILVDKLATTEFYPSLFEEAFGDPAITQERIGEALAQFVRSLNTFDSKYDRARSGQAVFTEAELEGEKLFKENCAVCHNNHHFSQLTPTSNSLPSSDPGYGAVTGNSADIGKFKTPSLRNIELTAPYMHDGRFQTLEEVLVFYSDSIPNPPTVPLYYNPVTNQPFSLGAIDFDETEIQNLLAFLKTLTSEELVSHEKFSDPFRSWDEFGTTKLTKKFVFSPNPFSSKTTIEFDNPTREEYAFTLQNINGQPLLSFSTQNDRIDLERDGLSAGVYFLKLRKGHQVKVEKLVVQ
ncbi:MAG: cytochrome c peroxidase [Saprospiraceae bacterium]